MTKQENETEHSKSTKLNPENSFVTAMLERGNESLKVGEWKKADSFYNKVLEADEKCAEAYLGKYFASVQKKNLHDCIKENIDIGALKDNEFLKKAYQYAAGDTKTIIESFYSEVKKKKNDNKPKKKKKSGIAVAVVAVVVVSIVAAMGNNIFKLKMKNMRVGDVITFGTYEQDNSISNGPEAIEWIVLDEKDGKLLLCSKNALDCKPYNWVSKNTTWEECSLRSWLNTKFMDAFTDEEETHILKTKVTADKNPQYDTNPGNDTEDKVFLLSIDEAEKYFSSNEARQCKVTKYTKSNHAWTDPKGNCWWWLRSPGYNDNIAAGVYSDGSVYDYGYFVYNVEIAVRPAMWINP